MSNFRVNWLAFCRFTLVYVLLARAKAGTKVSIKERADVGVRAKMLLPSIKTLLASSFLPAS